MDSNEQISNDEIENEKIELVKLCFENSDELVRGARAFFANKGYGLSIRGSRKGKYVVLGCDRGGFYQDPRNVSMKQRERITGSRLIGCLFKIKGKRQDNGLWMIEIKNYSHNHEASIDATGHPVCRRLLHEELKAIEHMTKSGVPPRQIISSFRDHNPEFPGSSRTIYNAKAKIRKENLGGRSLIQALLEELGNGGFMYDILDEGGHLTHLFFSHPLSVKLTQNYPNVFIMDCTYKTNRYKMPLLDIIGISSFNTSFYSGFAFLKRESERDYVWALKVFSKILGEKKLSVIITDRESALINAIRIVFPECTHLLCVWHVEKNILTKCKKYFQTEENWAGFLSSWNKIVYSSTELEYDEQWKEFQLTYVENKKALQYIESSWLPLKEKFVSAWTDNFLHFGNRASSRAESGHAKLKKYLQVSTGDLYDVRRKICLAIQNEFNEIKVRLSSEKMCLLHSCNNSFFKNAIYRVSLYALKELHKQYMKAKSGTMSPICSGSFTKTMGLPCAHRMANWRSEALNLELIHSQWRIDERSFLATNKDGCDDDFGLKLEELRTKYQEWPTFKKDMAHKKINEILNEDVLFEPIAHPPKGRPPSQNNKRKVTSSTRRDPSSFEIVEASHRRGLSKESDHRTHVLGEGSEASNASAIFFDLNVTWEETSKEHLQWELDDSFTKLLMEIGGNEDIFSYPNNTFGGL